MIEYLFGFNFMDSLNVPDFTMAALADTYAQDTVQVLRGTVYCQSYLRYPMRKYFSHFVGEAVKVNHR